MEPSTAQPAAGVQDADSRVEAPDLFLPFRRWTSSSPERSLTAVAVALIVLQGVVRGYVKFGGYFVADDLSFIARAETMPLWSREYLLAGWNGHFMPGAFLLVRGLNAISYMNYTPVAIVDIAMQAGLGYLVFALLRELFGSRRAILIPLVIFLFSPITLPAFVWWAAALNQLPGQLAMAGALLLHVRYLRYGRLRTGLLGVVVVLAGFAFSEKLLIFLPVVPAMTVLYFTAGPPMVRVRNALTRHWPIWVAYAVLTVGYLSYYTTQVPTPVNGNAPATTEGVVDTATTALGHAVIPGVFGGPWVWQRIGGVGGIANPGAMTTLLTGLAAVLLVWISVSLNYRASFAWTMIIGYELCNVVLLGISRARWVGPVIGAEYRYSTDACLIIAVFGAFAFLPIVGTFANAEPQRLVPRQHAAEGRRTVWSRMAPGFEMRGVSVIAVLLVCSSLVSTIRYDAIWRDRIVRPYFDNARSDIARAHRSITIADLGIRGDIQGGLAYPLNLTSRMFVGFHPRPTFLDDGSSSTELFVPDNDGHIRQASVATLMANAGPEFGCGYRIGQSGGDITFPFAALPWDWTVRVGYLATADGDSTVQVGNTTTKVHFYAGVHALYVMGQGSPKSIHISGLTDNASICTNDVGLGIPQPIPGTHP